MAITEYYGNNDWRDYQYLIHTGTLGMHWGIRRYQNPDGSLTPAGRERYGIGPPRDDGSPMTKREIRAEQRAVKRVIKGEKREKRQAKKDSKERKKLDKIVKGGDANAVKKVQNRLTNEELEYAIDRIKKTQTLDDLSTEKIANGKTKVESITKSLGSIVDLAETGVKAYNIAANVKNTFNTDEDAKLWKTIPSGHQKDKKKDGKKDD